MSEKDTRRWIIHLGSPESGVVPHVRGPATFGEIGVVAEARLAEAEASIAKLEADNASLRLERDGIEHMRLKDNEYLLADRNRYRAVLEKIADDDYGPWDAAVRAARGVLEGKES